MSQAIGEILALGIGVALSPVAVISVVLMLAAPGGRNKALAFLAAWVGGLAAVGTIALLLADGANASAHDDPGGWVSVIKIVIGLALLVVALTQWRGRPRDGEDPHLPGWMQKIEGVTARKAAATALLLAAVKPKNPLLTIAAAIAIAEQGLKPGEQTAVLIVFVLLGSLAPGIPVAIAYLTGARAPAILAGLRGWMVRNNATIVAVLCVLFAAKLISSGLGV